MYIYIYNAQVLSDSWHIVLLFVSCCKQNITSLDFYFCIQRYEMQQPENRGKYSVSVAVRDMAYLHTLLRGQIYIVYREEYVVHANADVAKCPRAKVYAYTYTQQKIEIFFSLQLTISRSDTHSC